MATVITMIGDQIVHEDAEAHFARIEAERTQAKHVENLLFMKGLSTRQDYLAGVANREGAEAAASLKEAFGRAWDAKHK